MHRVATPVHRGRTPKRCTGGANSVASFFFFGTKKNRDLEISQQCFQAKKCLEIEGIDPSTSRMLSERSTI